MKAFLSVAAVCLLFVAGVVAVDVDTARKSIVTQSKPITYSATTRIVNDLSAPDPNMAVEAPRDVVFSDDATDEANIPRQKVKRAPSTHALHQQVSMPAAGETGVTPIHRKKTAWNDEEIQRETIARVTYGIPELLKSVDTNMHKLREETLMDGVVNFLQTSEKVTSKEAPSVMLSRMKRQLAELDRRRSKLETVRDSIKEALSSKKDITMHASRRHSSPVLMEAASVRLADSANMDDDVKDWADQARFKQQKNDIDNLVTDADNALASMTARVKLDYE
jgi:hypothetical protein